MVVLKKRTERPIYFEDPIPKVHFMKLISCSLFNNWDTLKKEVSSKLRDKESAQETSANILPGHYNLQAWQKK